MTVDVVIVAYNSERTISDCIRSVRDDPLVARVLVVDNLSPDDSAERAVGLGATVIRSRANRGFGSGCNLGVAAGGAPWVLLLNPDARMEPGSLAGLVAYGQGHPGVGVVASESVGPSGRAEPVRRRFPVWWRAFAEPGLSARWDEARYRRTQPGAGPVDWASGSCLLVRRTAFEAVGGFDESFFLYAEETDLCARLRAAGWSTHWVRGCPSHHHPGSSTGSLPAAGKPEWARGFCRYLHKHDRRPRLVRASVLLGLWIRVVVWSARGRTETARKWRATASVVARYRPD